MQAYTVPMSPGGIWLAQAEARIDPESLERENDKDIDTLAEKTSFLRQVNCCPVLPPVMCPAELLAAHATEARHLRCSSQDAVSKLLPGAVLRGTLAVTQLTSNINAEVTSQNTTLDSLVRCC